MNYYYNIEGITSGPLPAEQLINIITAETLIWNEDGSMPDWKPAKEVSEFNVLSQPKQTAESTYLYIENQISLGPLTISELINKINKNTPVWNTNGTMTEWLPAIKLDEFKPYFKNEEPKIIIPTPPSVPFFRPEDYFNFQISEIVNRRPISGLFIKGYLSKGNIGDYILFSDKRQTDLELRVVDIYIHEKLKLEEIYLKHPLLKNLAGLRLTTKCSLGDWILVTQSTQNIKWGFNAERSNCEDCSIKNKE